MLTVPAPKFVILLLVKFNPAVVMLVKVGVKLVAICTSVPFCVMAMLLPAVNLAVPPLATCVTEVPVAVPVPVAAVVTLMPWLAVVATASSWPLLTASVAATPAPTFVMALLPALIPVTKTLGPPMMVRPLVSIFVLPVVTDVTLRLDATSTVTLVPACVITTLLEPALKSTVAPGATLVAAPPFVDRFQPAPATPFKAVSAEPTSLKLPPPTL